jgi:hypothetical protein
MHDTIKVKKIRKKVRSSLDSNPQLQALDEELTTATYPERTETRCNNIDTILTTTSKSAKQSEGKYSIPHPGHSCTEIPEKTPSPGTKYSEKCSKQNKLTSRSLNKSPPATTEY